MWTVAIDTDMSELKVMELYCHALLEKKRLFGFLLYPSGPEY